MFVIFLKLCYHSLVTLGVARWDILKVGKLLKVETNMRFIELLWFDTKMKNGYIGVWIGREEEEEVEKKEKKRELQGNQIKYRRLLAS